MKKLIMSSLLSTGLFFSVYSVNENVTWQCRHVGTNSQGENAYDMVSFEGVNTGSKWSYIVLLDKNDYEILNKTNDTDPKFKDLSNESLYELFLDTKIAQFKN